MAHKINKVNLGEGVSYTHDPYNPLGDRGVITGYVDSGVTSPSKLANEAKNFPAGAFPGDGTMPLRGVVAKSLDGGRAVTRAEYHRQDIRPSLQMKSGLRTVKTWEGEDGELNKEYSPRSGGPEPTQRKILSPQVTIYWMGYTSAMPLTEALLGVIGKRNTNAYAIQGVSRGLNAAGGKHVFKKHYLKMEAPIVDEYIWGSRIVYEVKYTVTYDALKWEESYLGPGKKVGDDPKPSWKNALLGEASFPQLMVS